MCDDMTANNNEVDSKEKAIICNNETNLFATMSAT